MLIELREYDVTVGRIQDSVKRFNEHNLRLFAKHGMTVVFIGRTAIGDETMHQIIYALRFESYADMEDRWAAFQADPEWRQVKDQTEATGPYTARVRRRIIDESSFPGAV